MHSEIYKGHKIEILPDNDPINPRTDYDNLSKMICFHKRYTLGDDHDLTIEQAKKINRIT